MFDVSSTSGGADVSGGSSTKRRKDPRKLDRYHERKVAGLCTRCGDVAVEDRQQCAAHLAEARESTKASMARKREYRREEGLCAYCGEVESETYACVVCSVRRGQGIPSTNVNNDVNNAARFKVGDDGRRRFHGQMRRGRQPQAQLDDQDLAYAIKSLEKAKAALAAARSPEVIALPKYQRDAAKRIALAQVDHSARFLEECLLRNNYVSGMQLRDADENMKRRGR